MCRFVLIPSCLFLISSASYAMCVSEDMRLVVLTPLSCEKLVDFRAKAETRWKEMSEQLPPKAQAEVMDRIREMLDHNQGIIITAQVTRERELWWNGPQGRTPYSGGEWKEVKEVRSYYYQTSRNTACKQFKLEESITMFADSSCCDVEPPDAIDCLLGMKVLWKLPKWSREFLKSSETATDTP